MNHLGTFKSWQKWLSLSNGNKKGRDGWNYPYFLHNNSSLPLYQKIMKERNNRFWWGEKQVEYREEIRETPGGEDTDKIVKWEEWAEV